MPEVAELGLEEDHPTLAEASKEVGHTQLVAVGGTADEPDC